MKDALTEMRERLKKDYITEKEYHQLCKKHRVLDSDRRTLLNNVRDLGLVSYFPELASLGLPPVLQPGWLTGGLYSLIDNPKLKKLGGTVKITEVYDWLREPERYERNHGLLFLKVAEHFRLGFALSGGKGEYMLTALLSEKTPKLPQWKEPGEELRLELHYTKVLPEGLLPQFIAVAHVLNGPGDARWRNGVELALNGARALVTADVPAKRITIRIRGQGRAPRDLMAVIRTHFYALSERMTPPEAMVPLSGYDADPLPYEHLLALEAAQQMHAQVTDRKRKFHLVPVQPLLVLYEDKQQRMASQVLQQLWSQGLATREAVATEGGRTRQHITTEMGRLQSTLETLADGMEASREDLQKVYTAVRQGSVDLDAVKSALHDGLASLEATALSQAQKTTRNLTHPGMKRPWRFIARPQKGKLKLTKQIWEFLLIDEHTGKVVVPVVGGQEILHYEVPRAAYASLIKWTKRVTALAFVACGVASAAAGGIELNPSAESDAADLTDLMDQAATFSASLDNTTGTEPGIEAVEFFQNKVLPANPHWEHVLKQVELPEGGWKWVGLQSLGHYRKKKRS